MPQFESHFFSSLIFWEVISFAILFAVLYKFAFPPILEMLETREHKIRGKPGAGRTASCRGRAQDAGV